ncbi:MAG: zinc-dependent metalloprotease [Dermatophilus congolensis]|nr:zinc-dependent metalloprotease [Dermatophilus congolensis]
MIDWSLATRTADRLVPPGPRIPADEARAAVAELREASRRATVLVTETSRLEAPADDRGPLVVNRRGWVEANAASFSQLFDPVVERLTHRPGKPVPSRIAQKVSGKVTGAEIGTLMAFLAARVLGQYEPAIGRPADEARLLLVAPNVVDVEQRLDLSPTDFRLWVCLHEETHRVQFTAVPWLRDHVLGLQQDLVTDLSGTLEGFGEILRTVVKRLPDAVAAGGLGLGELMLTDETRARLTEVNAVMALLEGHADVVMDDVGPAHVPSVDVIRTRFDSRREGIGPVDVLIRRLLGVEAKMAQYRDGAAFVRAVQAKVGVDGFNRVWTSPETLPTSAELLDPSLWLARVHA